MICGIVTFAALQYEDAKSKVKRFAPVFVAPITAVFLGAHFIECFDIACNQMMAHPEFNNQFFVDATGTLHKIDRSIPYKPHYVPSAKAIPVFFARHDIPAGAALTTHNVYAAGANLNEEEGRILANSKNHFGKIGDADSILGRRVKRKVNAGESIQNSNIDPPYSEEFILHESK